MKLMNYNFQFWAPGGPNLPLNARSSFLFSNWYSNICNKLLEVKGPTYRVQTFFLFNAPRGSAVAQWLSAWLETEGPRVRASPASLRCGPWARHIYPSLVLVQPRKTRPCLTERLLMGRKESIQTNKSMHLEWL